VAGQVMARVAVASAVAGRVRWRVAVATVAAGGEAMVLLAELPAWVARSAHCALVGSMDRTDRTHSSRAPW